jgi:2-iminobutanoate/2-iminopropanoate deaminase
VTAELRRFVVPGLRPPSGAYVHAVVHDGIVYCAGQVGIEPSTGIVPDGVGPQTTQALSNLAAVLAAVGSDFDHVVKATVYVRDAGTFSEMDAAFAEAFGATKPARTTIPGVDFRPGVDVEIDLIAAVR